MNDIRNAEKLQGVNLPIDSSWLFLAQKLANVQKKVNVYTTKYKLKKFQEKKMDQNEKDKICFQMREQSNAPNTISAQSSMPANSPTSVSVGDDQAAEATEFFNNMVCIEKKGAGIGINNKWMLLAKEIKEIEGEKEELNVYTIKYKPKKKN